MDEKYVAKVIESFIQDQHTEGTQASTIDNKFAAISVFCKYLDQPNVLSHIRRPEARKIRHIAPKSLDRNERNRLLREVEHSQQSRNIAVVYILLYTGLRVSELVSLNREDLVMKERSGWVQVRKARQIPLPVEARNYLQSI